MREHIFFYIVFVSQILIISFYFPRKILRQTRHVFDTYPPSTHPKLYTKPIECYEASRRNYQYVNAILFVAGLLILAALISTEHDGDIHYAIATGYFFAQMFPIILLDLKALKELKRMRNASSRNTRKAELRPRRLFDYISPRFFGIAAATYVAFCLLIIYVNQFGYEWFGGYLNILGISLINVIFAALAYWHMVGKKLNPHETNADRAARVSTVVRILAFTSIAATVFSAVSIALSAFDVRHLLPVFLSMYFQILAIVGFQAYRIENRNFDAYKEDPLST